MVEVDVGGAAGGDSMVMVAVWLLLGSERSGWSAP
jgi:hypothetical protein